VTRDQRCPNCQDREILLDTVTRDGFEGESYRCLNCGYAWDDSKPE
jgi:predicted RNA-binding Zn-ribbon protein involved in translation (DUF1610 family)